jgi:hypothetical protein
MSSSYGESIGEEDYVTVVRDVRMPALGELAARGHPKMPACSYRFLFVNSQTRSMSLMISPLRCVS